MNLHAVRAIYGFEMARTRRTLMQSVVSPVVSTSLYFVVFGAAIGSRIQSVGGVSYVAFIVPGLIMLSLLTQSVSDASFGIYFPRFSGTIYELLSAPVSPFETVLGLRRRGGHEVDRAGPDHPGDRGCSCRCGWPGEDWVDWQLPHSDLFHLLRRTGFHVLRFRRAVPARRCGRPFLLRHLLGRVSAQVAVRGDLGRREGQMTAWPL